MPQSSPTSTSAFESANSETRISRNLCVLRGEFLSVFRRESFLFLALWLFLLLAGRSAMLRDPGSFWHVAVGEKMLSTGQILRSDPFSFTFAGRPWVADQWLAECGMAAVHRLAGWDGLLLLTAALLAGVYTWIAARLLRGGLHPLPTGLLVALTLLVGSSQFHVRPVVLTIGLLAVTFAWLVDVEAGHKRLRGLWWLVPLFILWTNLHGGVLGGMGTVGLCAAGWCAAWALGNTSPVRTMGDAVQLVVLLVAIITAAVINPYGLGLPEAWLKTLAMPLPDLINEHARLALSEPIGWATLFLATGYLAVLVGVLPARPRVTWLVPLVWFVLTLLRVRNAPLFGVTAAVALADMLPHSRVGKWLERRAMLGTPRPSRGWRAAVLPLVVVAAAVGLQLAGFHVPVIGRGWARFDSACCPVGLLPELDRINRSAKEGERIFNDMNFGGFLIYSAPRLRVFVDDRCSLYGGRFLQAYDYARREDPTRLDRWRRQYGFRHALVETGGPFDRRLAVTPHWTPVACTPAATLYRWRMGLSSPIR